MSAIGPGDFVECIGWTGKGHKARPDEIAVKGPWPTVGSVHQVREADYYYPAGYSGSEPGVKLVGTVVSVPNHPDAWFPAQGFRPIYRPKAEFTEQLLKLATEDA